MPWEIQKHSFPYISRTVLIKINSRIDNILKILYYKWNCYELIIMQIFYYKQNVFLSSIVELKR